eukprot:1161979-Pelagomonas_calceolata.AAC.10
MEAARGQGGAMEAGVGAAWRLPAHTLPAVLQQRWCGQEARHAWSPGSAPLLACLCWMPPCMRCQYLLAAACCASCAHSVAAAAAAAAAAAPVPHPLWKRSCRHCCCSIQWPMHGAALAAPAAGRPAARPGGGSPLEGA